MKNIQPLQGDLQGQTAKLAILAARFNDYIVDGLLKGALDTLHRCAVPAANITLVQVPGAFELPQAAAKLAATKNYQGLVALGCVIRGATPHFDHIARTCSDGLARVALDYGLPIGFGVLTTDTLEQAIERAGTKAGNKGADAAQTVLEMLNLFKQL